MGNDAHANAMAILKAASARRRVVRDLDQTFDGGVLLCIEESKTAAGARRVEVPQLLAELLLRMVEGREADDPMWPADSETGYRSKTWLRKSVWRVCDRADVPRVTPHGLRGTHASLAREVGATGPIVARALGHEDQRTTERHYLARGTVERATGRAALKVLRGGK